MMTETKNSTFWNDKRGNSFKNDWGQEERIGSGEELFATNWDVGLD